MSTLIVIPARLASTRLPEKLLLRAGGKSILQHTYEAASRARLADGVLVAVDDPRLAAEVTRFGGEALLTRATHRSGTDRVAQVAAERPDAQLLVNVQGDEPEVDPATIDLVIDQMKQSEASIGTAACPIRTTAALNDPACVKVVIDDSGHALLFSRSPIPHFRDGVTDEKLNVDPPIARQHIGLYAYRREFLAWFAAADPGGLELAESLEQLRAMAAGHRIAVADVQHAAAGIDTLEDYRAFQSRLEGQSRVQ